MFDLLSEKFSAIIQKISGNSTLREGTIGSTLKNVESALLESDVPYDVVQDFVAQVKKEVDGTKVEKSVKPAEQLMSIIRTKIISFLGADSSSISFNSGTLVMMGLQGSGKTTTIGKLAHYVQNSNSKTIKILVASVDFYRPAAIKQLEIVAQTVGVDFYASSNTDPVQAAIDIKRYADVHAYDLLIVDTAGRLHVDETMLEELQNVVNAVRPTVKLLVVDAMTGQQSLNVARTFNERVGFDGAILSKMDSQAAGGAAFAFQYTLSKPILFLGSGEKHTDLELFKSDRIANRMLGNGDLVSLAEIADKKFKQSEQERLDKALNSGKMTLDDFALQIDMMNRVGPLGTIMKYMPQMGGIKLSQEQIQEGQSIMKGFRAIISSMTPQERANHKILNPSRKQRIARGSGCKVTQIDILLQRFEQMQQFAKLFKRM